VRLSHLFAARFPDVKSLGPSRYHFLASVLVPEDVLGNDAGPERRDVFLAGVSVHQLLFGKIPAGVPRAVRSVVLKASCTCVSGGGTPFQR
jgi:hypothetical protein